MSYESDLGQYSTNPTTITEPSNPSYENSVEVLYKEGYSAKGTKAEALRGKVAEKLNGLSSKSLTRSSTPTGDGYTENNGNKIWGLEDLNGAEYGYMVGLANSKYGLGDDEKGGRRLYMFGTKDSGTTPTPTTDTLYEPSLDEHVKLGVSSGWDDSSIPRYDGSKYALPGSAGVDVGKRMMDIKLDYDTATAVEAVGHSLPNSLDNRLIRKRTDGLFDYEGTTVTKGDKDELFGAGSSEYYSSLDGVFGDSRDQTVDKEKVARVLERAREIARVHRLKTSEDKWLSPEELEAKSALSIPLRERLLARESGGDYTAVNPGGYIGGYQFGAQALETLGYLKSGTYSKESGNSGAKDSSNWTGKDGVSSMQEFLANKEVQDAAFDANAQANLAALKSLGLITSSSTDEEVNGYLAASHLLGPKGAADLRSTDANNTTGQEYFDLGYGAGDRRTVPVSENLPEYLTINDSIARDKGGFSYSVQSFGKALAAAFTQEAIVDPADFYVELAGGDLGTNEEKTALVNGMFHYDPRNAQEAMEFIGDSFDKAIDSNASAIERATAIAEGIAEAATTPELLGSSLGTIAAFFAPSTLAKKLGWAKEATASVAKKLGAIREEVTSGQISRAAGAVKKLKVLSTKGGAKALLVGQIGHINAALGNVNSQYEEFVTNNNGVELEGLDKAEWFASRFGVQMVNQNLDAVTALSIIKTPALAIATKSVVKSMTTLEFSKFAKAVGGVVGSLGVAASKEAGQEYVQTMMEVFNERYGSEQFKDLDTFKKFVTDDRNIRDAGIGAIAGAGGGLQFSTIGAGMELAAGIPRKSSSTQKDTTSPVGDTVEPTQDTVQDPVQDQEAYMGEGFSYSFNKAVAEGDDKSIISSVTLMASKLKDGTIEKAMQASPETATGIANEAAYVAGGVGKGMDVVAGVLSKAIGIPLDEAKAVISDSHALGAMVHKLQGTEPEAVKAYLEAVTAVQDGEYDRVLSDGPELLNYADAVKDNEFAAAVKSLIGKASLAKRATAKENPPYEPSYVSDPAEPVATTIKKFRSSWYKFGSSSEAISAIDDLYANGGTKAQIHQAVDKIAEVNGIPKDTVEVIRKSYESVQDETVSGERGYKVYESILNALPKEDAGPILDKLRAFYKSQKKAVRNLKALVDHASQGGTPNTKVVGEYLKIGGEPFDIRLDAKGVPVVRDIQEANRLIQLKTSTMLGILAVARTASPTPSAASTTKTTTKAGPVTDSQAFDLDAATSHSPSSAPYSDLGLNPDNSSNFNNDMSDYYSQADSDVIPGTYEDSIGTVNEGGSPSIDTSQSPEPEASGTSTPSVNPTQRGPVRQVKVTLSEDQNKILDEDGRIAYEEEILDNKHLKRQSSPNTTSMTPVAVDTAQKPSTVVSTSDGTSRRSVSPSNTTTSNPKAVGPSTSSAQGASSSSSQVEAAILHVAGTLEISKESTKEARNSAYLELLVSGMDATTAKYVMNSVLAEHTEKNLEKGVMKQAISNNLYKHKIGYTVDGGKAKLVNSESYLPRSIAYLHRNLAKYVKVGKPTILNSTQAKDLSEGVQYILRGSVNALGKIIKPLTKFESTDITNPKTGFEGTTSPARALIITADGYFNDNVVLALKAALSEMISYEGDTLSTKTKTREEVARLFGVQSAERVPSKLMYLVADKGMLFSTLVSTLGGKVVSLLGLSDNGLTDVQNFPRLVADLGSAAVQLGVAEGILKFYEDPKTGKGVPSSELALARGDKQRAATIKPGVTTNFVSYASGYNTEDNIPVHRDLYEALPDLTSGRSVHHTSPVPKSTVKKLSTTVHKDPVGLSPSKTHQKALKRLMSIEHEIDHSLLREIIDNQDAYFRNSGYMDENSPEFLDLIYSERGAQESKNRSIESHFDILKELSKTSTGNPSVWFEWYTTVNQRVMINSNTINPMTDKYADRWIVQPKSMELQHTRTGVGENSAFTVNGKDVTEEVHYALAQAFGYDVDKKSPEDTTKFSKRLLSLDKESLETVKSTLLNEGSIELGGGYSARLSEIGHMLQGVMFLEGSLSGHPFKSKLSAETDALTSGFGLKLLQMPILDDLYRYLGKVGIVMPGKTVPDGAPTDSMSSLLSSDGFLDSYQTMASEMSPNIQYDEVLMSGYNEKNPKKLTKMQTLEEVFGKGKGEKVWASVKKKLPLVTPEGGVSKDMRDLFKDPFMTFNYARSLRNIRAGTAETLAISLLNGVTSGNSDDLLFNLSEAFRVSPEELMTRLKTEDYNEIQFKGVSLRKYLEEFVNSSYGAQVEEVFTNSFKEFIQAQDVINETFKSVFEFFNFQSSRMVEAVRKEKGLVTKKAKKEILDELLGSFTLIEGPLSEAFRVSAESHITDTLASTYKDGTLAITNTKKERGEGHLPTSFETADGVMNRSVGSDLAEFVAPGVAGTVLPIHSIDSAILLRTFLNNPDMVLVHDAIITALDNMPKAGKDYNENMFNVNKEYSFISAINDMSQRAIASVTESMETIKNGYNPYVTGGTKISKDEANKHLGELNGILVALKGTGIRSLSEVTTRGRSKLFKDLEGSEGSAIMHMAGTSKSAFYPETPVKKYSAEKRANKGPTRRVKSAPLSTSLGLGALKSSIQNSPSLGDTLNLGMLETLKSDIKNCK